MLVLLSFAAADVPGELGRVLRGHGQGFIRVVVAAKRPETGSTLDEPNPQYRPKARWSSNFAVSDGGRAIVVKWKQ